MKKFNLIFNVGKGLVASLFVLMALNSCTSEYHWVKVKSANPVLVKKEDLSSPIPASNDLTSNIVDLEKPAHGLASVNRQVLDQKAMEISKSLSPERISALNSNNVQIRTQAVKNTLHEQLVKNVQYAKLSSSKQEKLETRVAAKIAKAKVSNSGDEIWGINKLIVYGLALWVIGVLFLFIFWPLGLLIELVGSVVFIIGLIQQFS